MQGTTTLACATLQGIELHCLPQSLGSKLRTFWVKHIVSQSQLFLITHPDIVADLKPSVCSNQSLKDFR